MGLKRTLKTFAVVVQASWALLLTLRFSWVVRWVGEGAAGRFACLVALSLTTLCRAQEDRAEGRARTLHRVCNVKVDCELTILLDRDDASGHAQCRINSAIVDESED